MNECPAELEPGTVDVWPMPLNVPDERCQALRQVLTDEECCRADRFRVDRAQRQFTVARATLRHVLGRYLQQQPEHVQLTCDAHGKPHLLDTDNGTGLCFNVSHSHRLALIAVTWQCPVGIDIEHIRSSVRCMDLAERFFSPHEVRALQALPPAEQQAAFFACWTRKEAFLKAKGTGLRLPLNQFDVSVHPQEPARLLRVGWDPAEDPVWHLQHLTVDPTYMAALAIRAPVTTVRYRNAGSPDLAC